MKKDFAVSVLMDLYGELLTEKQKNMMEMYFNLDYSLSEIAENTGVSRQAALDNIKRGEAKLRNLEMRLGIKYKYETTEQELDEIESIINKLQPHVKQSITGSIRKIRSAWEDK